MFLCVMACCDNLQQPSLKHPKSPSNQNTPFSGKGHAAIVEAAITSMESGPNPPTNRWAQGGIRKGFRTFNTE